MTSRLSAIAVLLLLCHPWPADAQVMSDKELKKVLKQADRSYSTGFGERAAQLYEQVLAATLPRDPRRADALYVVAMAELSPEGPARDAAAARGYLDELTQSFPQHRRLEVTAVRELLAEIDRANVELARRDDSLEKEKADVAAQWQALEEKRLTLENTRGKADDRFKKCELHLRRMRAKLSVTEKKLDEKSVKLKELTDAMINRGG